MDSGAGASYLCHTKYACHYAIMHWLPLQLTKYLTMVLDNSLTQSLSTSHYYSNPSPSEVNAAPSQVVVLKNHVNWAKLNKARSCFLNRGSGIT